MLPAIRVPTLSLRCLSLGFALAAGTVSLRGLTLTVPASPAGLVRSPLRHRPWNEGSVSRMRRWPARGEALKRPTKLMPSG
jgi:hypothetical protein